MKHHFLFTFIFFIILLLPSCTRTAPSGPKADPAPPPVDQVEVNSFDTPIFKASGNEPFWSLQIDQNHTMLLKSIDDHQLKITAPITEITRVNDANALQITAHGNKKRVTIMLMENNCQDNMSDKKFALGLQVLVKDLSSNEQILYKGCGSYLNQYMVNNSWILETINGKDIASFPTEKAPTLNINLLEKKVNGFAGCNTFRGSVEMMDERMKFDKIGLTKKACKNSTVETMIIQLLNSTQQKHTLTKDDKLLIKSEEGTYIFKVSK